jgi:hypothetical protein
VTPYRSMPRLDTWAVEMTADDRSGQFEYITVVHHVAAYSEEEATQLAFDEAEAAGFSIRATIETHRIGERVSTSARPGGKDGG